MTENEIRLCVLIIWLVTITRHLTSRKYRGIIGNDFTKQKYNIPTFNPDLSQMYICTKCNKSIMTTTGMGDKHFNCSCKEPVTYLNPNIPQMIYIKSYKHPILLWTATHKEGSNYTIYNQVGSFLTEAKLGDIFALGFQEQPIWVWIENVREYLKECKWNIPENDLYELQTAILKYMPMPTISYDEVLRFVDIKSDHSIANIREYTIDFLEKHGFTITNKPNGQTSNR